MCTCTCMFFTRCVLHQRRHLGQHQTFNLRVEGSSPCSGVELLGPQCRSTKVLLSKLTRSALFLNGCSHFLLWESLTGGGEGGQLEIRLLMYVWRCKNPTDTLRILGVQRERGAVDAEGVRPGPLRPGPPLLQVQPEAVFSVRGGLSSRREVRKSTAEEGKWHHQHVKRGV